MKKAAENAVGETIINRFAQNNTTTLHPVNRKRSQLPLHQGINARRMELQQPQPMPRVQTRNAAFYYKRPVPSPRMKKERNPLPSGYFGSQRSYITENLRSRLQLKSLQNKKLNLNTFGESKFKKQNCYVVNLQLQKTEYDDPLTISALTFPVICWPLALPLNVSTSYAHLDGLELADEPCTSARSIDLLIGSDYYWNFVTGETKRGVKGPITINSKFYWLLSGSINEALDQGYVTYSNLIIEGQYPLFQPNADGVLAISLNDFWEPESNKSFEIDIK